MTTSAPYSFDSFTGVVSYAESGSGDPFILVHGTTGSRDTFAQITPVLAAKYRVILPEYSGSGSTTDSGAPLTPELLAAQVLAVADHLDVEQFHLGGWSLGAVAAATVAAVAPSRVRSLTLLNGWAKTDERMKFTFRLWVKWLADDPETFARYAFADGLTREAFELFTADAVETMVPMTVASLAAGSARQAELDGRVDITAHLVAITAPTQVVGGTVDRWVDFAHSESMVSTIPGAKLVALPCGHLTVTEQAGAVADLLDSHAAGAGG
jgi:3-oxoadipate enol-lactonase